MIPKVIHQVWIGNQPKPLKWMNTWKKKNPNWEYILWDEKKIKKLGLVNEDVYRFYYTMKCWYGCADVVRAEILCRFGGVYIDADMECTNSIDELADKMFFAVYEPGKLKGRVANGVIGVKPFHPVMKDYVMGIRSASELTPVSETIGAPLFKKMIMKYNRLHQVLPMYSFFKTDKRGNTIPAVGKNYANHYYASTSASTLERYNDKRFSHVVIVRCHYKENDQRFEWRLEYFKNEVLPRLLAQTNQNFDIAIYCNKAHAELFKELSDKIITFQAKKSNTVYRTTVNKRTYYSDFMPWSNVVGLEKYDIQTGLDSDDLVTAGYIERIQHEVRKRDVNKSLHITFQPDLLEWSTQKRFPITTHYSVPSRGSAFFSIYQPKKDKYIFAYEYSHLTIGENFKESIMITGKYCSMTIHGRNESTDSEAMVDKYTSPPRVSFSNYDNFGDKLNVAVLGKYIGKFEWVPMTATKKLVCMGSILGKSQEGDTIWGSGLMYEKEYQAPAGTTIVAVRGKLSRELIKGVDVPEVYGDPALLMPLVYHPNIKKIHKVGYIPHRVDQEIIPEKWKKGFVIDVTQDTYKTIDEILSCEKIVSSCLHGIIVAEAYGIPATWIELSDNVFGKGFKFRDYASSTNRIIEKGKELPPIENLGELQQGLIKAISSANLNETNKNRYSQNQMVRNPNGMGGQTKITKVKNEYKRRKWYNH